MDSSLGAFNYSQAKYSFAKAHDIQCYAPTNAATIEEKEAFYGLLETTLHYVKQPEIVILLGDLHAKIGDDNLGLKNVMRRYDLDTRNENGEMFIDLYVNYNLVIGGAYFRIKTYTRPHELPHISAPLTKLIMSPSAKNGGGHFLKSVVTGGLT